jgi:hypothetical protein
VLALHRGGPGAIVTLVVAHLRGDGPDQRVTLTTAATPEEILTELRRPDAGGLVALSGADGVLTVLNLPRIGWLTLEPVPAAP